MSIAHPIRPRMMGKVSLSFAIVAGQYNLTYTQGLVDHAVKELTELDPSVQTQVVWVPGAYEIPLIVKMLAEQKKVHAVLALGVVIQGETAHAALVTQAVSTALMNISLQTDIPVINEVLLLENEDQAAVRCLGTDINRGVEAARAAVSMARTVKEISPKLH